MPEHRFLVDGSELLEDAIERFVGGVANGRLDLAEQFAQLAFYLVEHEVGEERR